MKSRKRVPSFSAQQVRLSHQGYCLTSNKEYYIPKERHSLPSIFPLLSFWLFSLFILIDSSFSAFPVKRHRISSFCYSSFLLKSYSCLCLCVCDFSSLEVAIDDCSEELYLFLSMIFFLLELHCTLSWLESCYSLISSTWLLFRQYFVTLVSLTSIPDPFSVKIHRSDEGMIQISVICVCLRDRTFSMHERAVNKKERWWKDHQQEEGSGIPWIVSIPFSWSEATSYNKCEDVYSSHDTLIHLQSNWQTEKLNNNWKRDSDPFAEHVVRQAIKLYNDTPVTLYIFFEDIMYSPLVYFSLLGFITTDSFSFSLNRLQWWWSWQSQTRIMGRNMEEEDLGSSRLENKCNEMSPREWHHFSNAFPRFSTLHEKSRLVWNPL
jgi:hypothetical protein